MHKSNVENLYKLLDYKRREELDSAKVDHLQDEQKNMGLINTIVNHNNQLKSIDNKFNFVINNFANSSHVKEIIERTNELEKHIVGAPRPHRSWREFVLVSVGLGILVGVLIKVVKSIKKCCIPRLIEIMSGKPHERTMEIATVGKQVDYHNDKDSHLVLEVKNLMEQQIKQQNHQLDMLARKLNGTAPDY